MGERRKSGGLLLGEASLSRSPRAQSIISGSTEGGSSHSSSSSSFSSNDGTRSVYLSGFRIVQEADKSRHAEYAVVLSGRHRRWTRFSQIKAVFKHLSGPSMPDTSRKAWNVVRSCKSPRGRALDTAHLGRKCLAIEVFLGSLLENMSPAYLEELLLRATPRSSLAASSSSSSPRRKVGSSRNQPWVPGAPLHISRGRAGLRIATR
ncbi:unnamed protein product [Pylaiella littoralis]